MSRTLMLVGALALGATAIGARALLNPLPDTAAARACAPEAGMIALTGSQADRVRLLYAQNGAMILMREIRVPGKVRALSLSADGRDVFVSTDDNAYTLSTRTGRIEAELLAAEARPAPLPSRSHYEGG